MSIIERSNPLNLQYRICIVTSASSTLGIIVCKTLLKANALVLGVDARAKDHSLSASPGTHFQFEQCDVNEKGAAERIVDAAREKFDGRERLDVLVNIIDDRAERLDGLRSLSEEIGAVMMRERQGSIINVFGAVHEEDHAEIKNAVGC